MGETSLMETPSMHIGGFLSWSRNVGIKKMGTGSILWRKDEDPDHELDLGDFQGDLINTGSTDSLDSILEDLGVSLCQSEIESYMRDELFKGNDKLDCVIDRCFKSRILEFYDERQNKAFKKYLQDLWKSIKHNYNPFQDQQRGEIRRRILQIIDKQLQWLRSLDKKNMLPGSLPGMEMITLAESSGMLNQMLIALESEASMPDKKELDTLIDTIDQLESTIQLLMDDVNDKI